MFQFGLPLHTTLANLSQVLSNEKNIIGTVRIGLFHNKTVASHTDVLRLVTRSYA